MGLENLSFKSKSIYRVKKEVGRGGMGIILLAEKDTGGIKDEVVLKTVKTLNKEDEEKLRNEANIATMLRHENIVKTYGLEKVPLSKLPPSLKNELISSGNKGFFNKFIKPKKIEEKNIFFMVMDYIKGTDFHTLIYKHFQQNLLFPVPLAAFVIYKIANALSYAHTFIVHRDVSPENILISDQGVCKLTDFGIAIVAHTKTEYKCGKLMYMAPEQLRDEDIDERVDIFALGLVAYLALTGIPLFFASPKLPFEEQLKRIYSQLERGFIPPHLVRKDIPISLSKIIYKMLNPLPQYRYQRMSAVAHDLEKEYLYAKGFGPTNNSLSAYIDIFNSNFSDYNEEHLQQLTFLRNEKGEFCLKRKLTLEGYTAIGQRFLAERKGSFVFNQLRRIHKEKQRKSKSVYFPAKIPILKVKYLDNLIESFLLSEKEITVGRSKKNTIILPSLVVSAKHAKFYIKEGKVWVEDVGSNNGTYLNNIKIVKSQLKEGDRIQIGPHLFYFIKEVKKEDTDNYYTISLLKEDEKEDINKYKLDTPKLAIQFSPISSLLLKASKIIEQILKNVPLGKIKRDLTSPALFEVIKFFTQKDLDFYITVYINRTSKYISFKISSNKEKKGYEFFLSQIHKRLEFKFKSKKDEINMFDSDEIALSLILKVFDRIELIRYKREVICTNFF